MLLRFFIRLQHWEYWPIYVVYIPLYAYYLFLSLRARSFFFFTASNPGIENGGMLGESKYSILENIEQKPVTILIQPGTKVEEVAGKIQSAGIDFPVIAKPDVGERGWGVRKIRNAHELEVYVRWCRVPFIIQEFVNLPLEAGVFYHRMPGKDTGKITSIVFKELLTVTGDGRSTLRQLVYRRQRAILQAPRLKREWREIWNEVVPEGKQIELCGIGNHSLGTKFIDATDLVNFDMVSSFNSIAAEIEGFYFGRFDLRCKSLNELRQGKVMIMELNGAGAEPAHIYEPGFSFFDAQKVLLKHMNLMYKISRENNRNGVPYMSFREGMKEIRKLLTYDRSFRR